MNFHFYYIERARAFRIAGTYRTREAPQADQDMKYRLLPRALRDAKRRQRDDAGATKPALPTRGRP
jgi:hypothetical protein